VYGGWAQVNYGDTANNQLCWASGNGTIVAGLPVATAGCDMNWQTWWVGTRTQWNVTKDFYMGLDVMYSRLESATALVSGGTAFAISPNLGFIPKTDPDNWSFRFRVHRDFYP